jgi:hypothetical protein
MSYFDGDRTREIEIENRRLIGRPRAWIAEFPHLRREVEANRTGLVGALMTIVETLLYFLWSGAVIAAPIISIIAILMVESVAELIALVGFWAAIIVLTVIPFVRGWASLLQGHPRRNAGVLVLGLGALACDAASGAFVAAHINLAALWAPQ